MKPAVPRFSIKTEQSVNDECGKKSSVNNAAGQVTNDAGDIYDSAGSIQIDKIHNDTCGSASSQEVFNTGYLAKGACEQVGAADMSNIIQKVCRQQQQQCCINNTHITNEKWQSKL